MIKEEQDLLAALDRYDRAKEGYERVLRIERLAARVWPWFVIVLVVAVTACVYATH